MHGGAASPLPPPEEACWAENWGSPNASCTLPCIISQLTLLSAIMKHLSESIQQEPAPAADKPSALLPLRSTASGKGREGEVSYRDVKGGDHV